MLFPKNRVPVWCQRQGRKEAFQGTFCAAVNKMLKAQTPQTVQQQGWDHPGGLALHALLWMIRTGRCKDEAKLNQLLALMCQGGSPNLEFFTGMPIATVGESKNGQITRLDGLVRLLPVMIYRMNKLFKNGNEEVPAYHCVLDKF